MGINFDDAGGRVTTDELTVQFSNVTELEPTGNIAVNLPMRIYLDVGGFGMETAYIAQLSLSTPSTWIVLYGSSLSTDPMSGFGDINYAVGDFISNAVRPFLENVQEYNPLPDQVVDVLTYEVPILEMSAADLLGDWTDSEAVEFLLEISSVVNSIPGDLDTLDLSEYFPGPAGASSTIALDDPGEQTSAYASDSGDTFLDDLADYGITFPIVDDFSSSIMSIIEGGDVDLVNWDPDPFSFKETLNQEYPLAMWGIPFLLNASINFFIEGSVEFFGNVEMGLSTRGFSSSTPGDFQLMDGFYIGDNKSSPSGTDDLEMGLRFTLAAGVNGKGTILGFDAVKIEGSGGLQATMGIDLADVAYDANGDPEPRVGLNDSGGDNRVYLDELEWITRDCGPFCAVTLSGKLDFVLSVSAKLLRWKDFWGKEYYWVDESATETYPLFNWDSYCTNGNEPEPVIAFLTNDSIICDTGEYLDYHHGAHTDPTHPDFAEYSDYDIPNSEEDPDYYYYP